MAITAGQDILASDFISSSAGAADAGKATKLNSVGRLDQSFITHGFGGDGSDGALNITSGTTTIDLASANLLVKNYSSINISSGATLAFSNPANDGSIIIFRCTGAVTIAGTIDLRNLGSVAGTGGTTASAVGTSGTAPYHTGWGDSTAAPGALTTPTGSGNFTNTAAIEGTNLSKNLTTRMIKLVAGGGGGGGQANDSADDGGNGGRGSGSMLIECVGVLSITGTIHASGANGSNGATSTGGDGAGGGGGGGGGQFICLYNSTITNSGTYNIFGGNGGNGAASSGVSGGSGSGGGNGGSSSYYGGGGGIGRSSNGNNGNNGLAGGGPSGGSGGSGGAASGVASGGSGGGGGGSGCEIISANIWFV